MLPHRRESTWLGNDLTNNTKRTVFAPMSKKLYLQGNKIEELTLVATHQVHVLGTSITAATLTVLSTSLRGARAE